MRVVRLLNAPIATVTLVDADRQFFKSAVGLPEPMARARQTPLSRSVCRHAVGTGTTLVIPDTRSHPLLREQPEVAEQGIVAYLGVPLRAASGHVLGTLCVMDSQARVWSGEDVRALEDLAAAAMVTLGQAGAEPDAGEAPHPPGPEAAETAEAAVLDVTSELYWAAENYLERLADYDALVHAHDYARGAPLPAEEEVARNLVVLGERELRAAAERYQEAAPAVAPAVTAAETPAPLQAVASSGRALWFAALAYFERQARREETGARFAAGGASLREVEEASTLARFAEGDLRVAVRTHAEARHLLAVSHAVPDPEQL
jgi:hypothetical protein